MSSRWTPNGGRTQIKLCIQRVRSMAMFELTVQLRMTAAKKEAMLKSSRREIATLVEKAKLETARVRVETIINEEIHIELLEILELYCELLSARFGLLEVSRDIEPSISEAVYGIVHASLKTELRELHQLREMLLNHFGRTLVETSEEKAAERVKSKLAVRTPASDLVDAYLYEICRAYSVPFARPASMGEEPTGPRPTVEEPETVKPSDPAPSEPVGTSDFDRRLAALKKT